MNARHADRLTDFEITPRLVKIAPESHKPASRKPANHEGYSLTFAHKIGLVMVAVFIISAICR